MLTTDSGGHTSPVTKSRPWRSPMHFIFSLAEAPRASDRFIFRALLITIIGSLLFGIALFSIHSSQKTPVRGGTLIEGVVGVPRFVNPVLAVTRADQDVTALVFRGLMKIDIEGNLIPDIADQVTLSSDGTIYNIIIKNDIRFHDNTPLTARDVTYTIGLLQDADLKSPLRGSWTGVAIEEIGEYEFNIILSEPYAPFIENLTFGIIPRHIWSELPTEQIPFSQRNTDPIGAGPYRVKEIVRSPSGIIDSYVLEANPYFKDEPMIGIIRVRFYQNEDTLRLALERREITSTMYAPQSLLKQIENDPHFHIIATSVPRLFSIFFNQNRSPVLRDLAARQALSAAIDREQLVVSALGGYGVPTNSPVPNDQNKLELTNDTTTVSSSSAESAVAILTAGGWRLSEDNVWEKRIAGELTQLQVIIRTSNNPTFMEVTESVIRMWRDIGILVQTELFEQSDLLQTVIRPRDFDALLFGIDMNRSVDLYPFWHSSQREDPGLNIAQYANITVDAALQNARQIQDASERDIVLASAINTIVSEQPAAFLFTPQLTYVVTTDLTTAPIVSVSRAHERFMNISNWHIATEDLWTWFRND